MKIKKSSISEEKKKQVEEYISEEEEFYSEKKRSRAQYEQCEQELHNSKTSGINAIQSQLNNTQLSSPSDLLDANQNQIVIIWTFYLSFLLFLLFGI